MSAQFLRLGYSVAVFKAVAQAELKVILKFKTSKELWDFKAVTNADCAQINTSESSLTCDLSEREMALAVDGYEAVLTESVAML